jgi:hypothetical protein
LRAEAIHNKEAEKRREAAAAARTAALHKQRQLVAESKNGRKFHRDLVDNYTQKRSTVE